MDSKVIKCDVDFGMTVDPVFASKASPSHESDSGCSDMSEVRSVSPLSEVDFMSADGEVKLFDFESVAVDEDNELDKELETYLAVPLSSETRANLKTPEVQVRPVINLPDQGSPDIEVDSDSNDPDYMPKQRIIQSRALREKQMPEANPCASVIQVPFMKNSHQTDIHILRSSSKTNSYDKKCISKASPPAVKVVKVVKTAAQTKQEIDDELLKALDDRNKKNAVQAKMNREKKKAYIKSLEDEIEELKCENFTLKENERKVSNERNELKEEIEYLKSVLANQSALSGLLKNIGNVENVKLSSSLNRKRSADLDHDYHNVVKRGKLTVRKTAGVCLHVDQGNVSLEFCSKCASMAKSGEME
ncbi:uncharacterized protein LOC123563972 [Mercenaria mercenaria]|uniref:uncharacterized protein LOC123563972 n=1 Tax=Mercenaria mercenaria TaxID=6596 RepID=UPI00234F62AE|nr:uncharacterized protein LOC123563972 [Mercenaria mercenaria]